MNAALFQQSTNRPIMPDRAHHPQLSHDSPAGDTLDKRGIAELSSLQIAEMSRHELIDVVRSAQMELLHRDITDHVELYDRETLKRLAHLARRCCRNQGY